MNPLCFRLLLLCFLVWFCPLVGFGQSLQIGEELIGTQAGQQFGSPIDISRNGKVIAVASANLNGTGKIGVQLYELNNRTWILKGSPIIGQGGNRLSLSSNGNNIVITAPLNNGGSYQEGETRVYEWNSNNWVQKGSTINGEAAGDRSGTSVSMSEDGNTIAIGTPNNDDNGSLSGHVRIYEWDSNNWIQKGMDIDGEAAGDWSGMAVCLGANGNVVAIGAPYNEDNGQLSGHVRAYEWNGVAWIQKGMDIDGEAVGDQSGLSVSISSDGNTLAVGAIANDGNGVNSGHARIYEWNGVAWIQKGMDIDGEAAGDESGSAVSISSDGNTIAIGAVRNSNNGIDAGHVRIFQWNDNNWIQRGVDIDGEAPGDLLGPRTSVSGEGNIVVVGSFSNDAGGIDAGKVRIFYLTKSIFGKVYFDLNQNCQEDSLENGLNNQILLINPGGILVQTTAGGYWGIDSLPIGTYTITTDTNPNNNYQPCAPSYTFTVVHPDSIVQAPSIGYQATQQCISPNTSINMPFMRPGFSNQKVYVQACNDADATTILNNAYVIVTLDSLLTIDTASKIYTSLGSNTYQVNIGDLYPGQCTNFWLNCTLSQNAILGSSLCMEATLYPIDSCALDSIPNNTLIPCTTPFDFSHLVIEGDCHNNDTISFTITNVEGDMSCWSQTRLYIDGTLTQIDSIQLQSGQSQTFTFPADGRTWRMEVDQHPLHWGNSQPSATIELCGNAANWTPDLVNILPHDDADPVVDIFCGLVTGSYDPNDKTGFPTGIGTSHDVLPNQKIEYRIRFQNTGTDTAFTVVIRDTLSTDFDIFSVQSGVSSHDYSFRIYGPRVLEWTFNNIMLPDSNVNEPASNGFVKFEVMQQPNLPNGTVLENSAGIYFDFNAPIITNTSTHTINDGVVILDMTAPISKQMQLKVYPNPTDNVVTVELGKTQEFNITVLNQLGQVLHAQKATNNSSQVQLGQLPAGIYYLHIHDGQQTAVQKVIKQ